VGGVGDGEELMRRPTTVAYLDSTSPELTVLAPRGTKERSPHVTGRHGLNLNQPGILFAVDGWRMEERQREGRATRSFLIRAKVFVACDVVFWGLRSSRGERVREREQSDQLLHVSILPCT